MDEEQIRDEYNRIIDGLEGEILRLRAGIMECEIAKLSALPGENVVLTCPYFIDDKTAELLKTYCERELPGVKFFILGDGMTLSVVKDVPHDLAAAAVENARLRARLQKCKDDRTELEDIILKRKRKL